MEEQDGNQLSDIESYLVNFNREVAPEDLPSAANAAGQTSEYLYRTNTILSNGDDIYGDDAMEKPAKADGSNDHENDISLIETQNINHDNGGQNGDRVRKVYSTVSVLPTQEGQVKYMLILSPPQPLEESLKLEEKDNGYKKDNQNELSIFDFDGHAEGGEAEPEEEEEEEENVLKEDEEEEEPPSKKLKSEGNTFKCYYCNYSSTKRFQMAKHLKSHSNERPFKCEYCSLAFKSRLALTNHTNTHKGLRPNKCKECDACFTSAGELVRHVRYKHTYEKPHRCKMCNYASVELSKLRRHIRSHTGERPYKCPHCTYASPDTFKLKRHLRVHTGERPYKCDICEMRFTQSNSLKSHRLIHTGERPIFKCELCPSTCTRKTDLRNHVLRIHTSDEPLLCRKCGKNFPDRYTFRIHSRTHDGQKCFKCELCPYTASVQRHLEHHIMTHTGERPYKCELCQQAFRQKTLLRKHYATSHQDDDLSEAYPELTLKQRAKIHVCPHCKRAFANSGCLENHINRLHGDDGEDDDEEIREMAIITRRRTTRGSLSQNGHLNQSGEDVELLRMEAQNDDEEEEEDAEETPRYAKKPRYAATPKSGGKTPLQTSSGPAKKKRGRPRKNVSLVSNDSDGDYIPVTASSATRGASSTPRRIGRPAKARQLSYKEEVADEEEEEEEEEPEEDYDDDDDDDVTYRANNSRLIRRKAKQASDIRCKTDLDVNDESEIVMESLSCNGGEDYQEGKEEERDGAGGGGDDDGEGEKDDFDNMDDENIKEED